MTSPVVLGFGIALTTTPVAPPRVELVRWRGRGRRAGGPVELQDGLTGSQLRGLGRVVVVLGGSLGGVCSGPLTIGPLFVVREIGFVICLGERAPLAPAPMATRARPAAMVTAKGLGTVTVTPPSWPMGRSVTTARKANKRRR